MSQLKSCICSGRSGICSGCHWTATISLSRSSIDSIVPSSAQATATSWPEGSGNSPTRLEQPERARRGLSFVALSFLFRLARRVLDLIRVHRMDTAAKDAEILVLRHQLTVLRRQVACPRFTWSDRALVALLAGLVPREHWRSFLVTPETILGWHRSLVRKRWTYPHRRQGRPTLPEETVNLILRLARENPRWGYLRIVGELKKLGVTVSKTSVATVSHRHPGERAQPGPSSSPPRRRVSWPRTSSTSTRCSSGATTCCPSSRCTAAQCTSSAPPPTRTAPGWPRWPATSPRIWRMPAGASGSSSATVTRSSRRASTRYSHRSASSRSTPRSVRLVPTRTPSDSYALSARSASIICWSSHDDISNRCSMRTSSTTTMLVHTVGCTLDSRSPAAFHFRPPRSAPSLAKTSSAASSTNTSGPPDHRSPHGGFDVCIGRLQREFEDRTRRNVARRLHGFSGSTTAARSPLPRVRADSPAADRASEFSDPSGSGSIRPKPQQSPSQDPRLYETIREAR